MLLKEIEQLVRVIVIIIRDEECLICVENDLTRSTWGPASNGIAQPTTFPPSSIPIHQIKVMMSSLTHALGSLNALNLRHFFFLLWERGKKSHFYSDL